MNKSIFVLAACLIATSAIAAKPPVQSPQNPFMPPDMKVVDVPLTAASIQKVLASFTRLRGEFKDYQPSEDPKDMQNYMQGDDASFKKAESIVREAGFKDFPDWSANFAKVMQTYMARNMQKVGKVNQAQIDQQMKALENNPHMTAEQKEAARNMMGMANMYSQMAAAVPDKDLKTLEPYIGQLEQVMQSAE
jgi:hypothetical protein